MRGQHRLNLQFVQAAPDLFRGHAGLPKLLKKAAQRHRGRRSGLQVANPGALLAQVDDLEEQAQRMGDLVGLADTKPMNERALGPKADVGRGAGAPRRRAAESGLGAQIRPRPPAPG